MKKWFVLLLALCFVGTGYAEEKKDDGKAKPKGMTKAQYVAKEKAQVERKGKEFDQAATEAKFDEMDKNKDGILTEEEKKAAKKKEDDKKKNDEGETESPDPE